MAIASYADLQTSVAKWLKRADLSALIPDFVTLAETELNRKLRTSNQRITFSITPTSISVSLPSDLLKIIKIYWNGAILPYLPEDMLSTNPAFVTQYGYSIAGNKIVLQVPQLGQVLRIDYYSEIESLSNSNTSNWLLEDAPDVYLYATLIQAALYIRDDDRVQLWNQVLTTVLSDLSSTDKAAQTPQQSMVMRKG